MRLLNTITLEMHEFFASSTIGHPKTQQPKSLNSSNSQILEYAILSHVWGLEEVSFQDIMGSRVLAEKKIGYAKIVGSCRQARQDGFNYIWIDTCCIDKTSSTELSEAINSMFQWYHDSKICYAYLADVDVDDIALIDDAAPGHHLIFNPKIIDDETYKATVSQLTRPILIGKLDTFHVGLGKLSRWFLRGWTLQELLAPSEVNFFDKNWIHLGNRTEHLETIAKITGIDLYALRGGDLRRMSIARRMAWAAKR
ncbi:hypothetical protein IFR05_002372 [Cadophora sp. M221]|nr:hypothetical protein IFR05_002372 [Cadophora sp. M221]